MNSLSSAGDGGRGTTRRGNTTLASSRQAAPAGGGVTPPGETTTLASPGRAAGGCAMGVPLPAPLAPPPSPRRPGPIVLGRDVISPPGVAISLSPPADRRTRRCEPPAPRRR